jgi:hypothetical protein
MITTVTVERMCLHEESQWPDTEWKQERLQWLTQELEAGRYGNLEKDFTYIGAERVPHYDRPQLWCEAIKFHELRLAGFSLHQALERMVGVAHA